MPSITIIAEGDARSTGDALLALRNVPEVSVTEIGEERGLIEGTGQLIKWAVEFAGDASGIADALVGIAEKYFAGSAIKVRFGEREIEVSNVRRDDLLEVLSAVQKMAEEADAL